ncbi:MAG: LamG-like jellyroll fold domain-containing protein [Acidobacteriota bacterium]
MSRDFVGAGGELITSAAVVTGPPLTMAGFVKRNSLLNEENVLVANQTGNAEFYRITILGDSTVRYQVRDLVGNANATSTGTIADTTTWHHIAAQSAASNDHDLFIDGSADGSSGTDRSPSSIDVFQISSGIGGDPLESIVAQVGVWAAALTAAEIAALASGVSPYFIRPGSLRAYYPWLGYHSPDLDIIGGFNLSVTGTVKNLDEPNVSMPFRRSKRIMRLAAPAAGGISRLLMEKNLGKNLLLGANL